MSLLRKLLSGKEAACLVSRLCVECVVGLKRGNNDPLFGSAIIERKIIERKITTGKRIEDCSQSSLEGGAVQAEFTIRSSKQST